jgi:hypothetical protein
MKKHMMFYCLVMITGTCFSQLEDTLFFNNGSVVIGEIKKIRLGVLTFDPSDANDISVQLRNLKTITGVTNIFRIETVTEDVYYGKLIPHGSNNYVKMVQGHDTSILFLQDISIMYPFEKTFLNRFSGNVGLGYSYTRSSNFGRLNFDGGMNYAARKLEISLSASGIYTMTDSSFTRDNENFDVKSNYYFSTTWFATAFLAYQRNLELGLDRRYQEGVGVGNKFITSKHVYTWARGGLVFNQERNTENVTTGTLTELFGQVEFNFFRFVKPEINFNIAQTLYYSLSQKGRFRSDGQASLSWEIINDLDLNLTFYDNYDSKPPAADSKEFDFGVTFGVSYSF